MSCGGALPSGMEYPGVSYVRNGADNPEHMLINNPDGSVMLISKENPYYLPGGEEDEEEIIQIGEEDNDSLSLLYYYAERVEWYGGVVKTLSLIDVTFSLYYLSINQYPGILTCLCSLCGYWGARNFNRCLVVIYSLFLFLNLMGRALLTYNCIEEGMISLWEGDFYISIVVSLFQLFILCFVLRFIYLLPSREDHRLLLNRIIYSGGGLSPESGDSSV